MKMTTIAKNEMFEIKSTGTGNFILCNYGIIIKHLCPSEVESLRSLLNVPILEHEVLQSLIDKVK